MRIIVLEQMPDKGKTTTLWIVRDLLLSAGGTSTAFNIFGTPPIPYKNDFEDVIINYKSFKIGLYSSGDYSNGLASAIRSFATLGCDVLICPLSLNSPKINANKEINKHSNIRQPKTVETNKSLQGTVNTTDANTILSLI
jgi:hypothetical protein